MPQGPKNRKHWNDKVKTNVEILDPIKKWLDTISKSKTDWETQKSAHQAIHFLELAQYEMWNMQWWENSQQVKLHKEAHRETI